MLPVPELIPFRLTPQLRSLLRPLDGTGLLRQYMVQALEILRAEEGRGILTNALEVYVNDPVVDWMSPLMQKDDMLEYLNASATDGGGSFGSASFGSSSSGGSSSSAGGSSSRVATASSSVLSTAMKETQRRVGSAVRKLNGAHPITLMLEDLGTNNAVKHYKSIDALTTILMSTCPNNPSSSSSSGVGRSRSGAASPRLQETVDAGQQVDILLQMATSPNILARQWTGLATHV